MIKKYLPYIFLSIIFVTLLVFLSNRSSLNFVSEKQIVPTTQNSIVGIQLTQCCPCPTVIDASQIGENGWVEYQRGKNYSEQLPQICSSPNIGMCAPCPSLTLTP